MIAIVKKVVHWVLVAVLTVLPPRVVYRLHYLSNPVTSGGLQLDRASLLIARLHPLQPDTELVRLGPKGDGGYLVPEDLVGVKACFSPGVGDVAGFESDCVDRGMQVFLADGSVDRPPQTNLSFRFTKKFVGAETNETCTTLADWVDSSLEDKCCDLLLQCDIEGGEYEMFLAVPPKLMQRFRVIVAEFHYMDHLTLAGPLNIVARTFEKILLTHKPVHLHPNNCATPLKGWGLQIPPVMEFTFLRSDRINGNSYRHDFPHPDDYDNTGNPSVPLPSCWYGGTKEKHR